MSKKYSVKSRLIFYILVAVFFVVSAYFIAMSAMGYRYFWKNGKVEVRGTGAIILSSRPGDAQVLINGQTFHANTPIFNFLTVQVNNLTPGDYKVTIKKAGFVTWQGVFKVYTRMVSWGNQILLLPVERQENPYNFTAEAESVITSPDRTRELVLTHDKQNAAFAVWQIDTTTKVSTKLFEKYLSESETYKPLAYSFDNQRILFEDDLGTQKSFLVYNAAQNGSSWNITNTFKESFDSYTFNPRNHDEIFGIRSGDLFRINYSSKTLSGVVYSNVRGLYPDGISSLMMVQKDNNYINLYRLESNNSETLLVRGLTDSTSYQIANLGSDAGYAVLPFSTKVLVVYVAGRNPDVAPTKIAGNVDFILPSPKNQFLGYGANGGFYCFENGKNRYFTTYQNRQVSSIVWFDDQFNLAYIENGKLKMITYSGDYDQNIFDASNNFPVVASPTGPHLFFIAENKTKKLLDLFSFDFQS